MNWTIYLAVRELIAGKYIMNKYSDQQTLCCTSCILSLNNKATLYTGNYVHFKSGGDINAHAFHCTAVKLRWLLREQIPFS